MKYSVTTLVILQVAAHGGWVANEKHISPTDVASIIQSATHRLGDIRRVSRLPPESPSESQAASSQLPTENKLSPTSKPKNPDSNFDAKFSTWYNQLCAEVEDMEVADMKELKVKATLTANQITVSVVQYDPLPEKFFATSHAFGIFAQMCGYKCDDQWSEQTKQTAVGNIFNLDPRIIRLTLTLVVNRVELDQYGNNKKVQLKFADFVVLRNRGLKNNWSNLYYRFEDFITASFTQQLNSDRFLLDMLQFLDSYKFY